MAKIGCSRRARIIINENNNDNRFTVEERYVVNEKNKTVTCVIKCRSDMAIKKLFEANMLFNEYFDPTYTYGYPQNWYMPTKFVGVAKCNEENTFDLAIGKGFAYNKAHRKFLKAIDRTQANIIGDITKNLFIVVHDASEKFDKNHARARADRRRLILAASENSSEEDFDEALHETTKALAGCNVTSEVNFALHGPYEDEIPIYIKQAMADAYCKHIREPNKEEDEKETYNTFKGTIEEVRKNT